MEILPHSPVYLVATKNDLMHAIVALSQLAFLKTANLPSAFGHITPEIQFFSQRQEAKLSLSWLELQEINLCLLSHVMLVYEMTEVMIKSQLNCASAIDPPPPPPQKIKPLWQAR